MDYDKKVAVLKQVNNGYALTGKEVNGIARIENENGIATLYLSVLNILAQASGEYTLFILDSNHKLFNFSLDNRPNRLVCSAGTEINISNGFAVTLTHISNNLPYHIASGKTNESTINLSNFYKLVADHCLENFKQKQKIAELETKKAEELEAKKETELITKKAEVEKAVVLEDLQHNAQVEKVLEITKDAQPTILAKVYDDEAVATENYFEADTDIQNKLKAIKEWDFENCSYEDELFTSFSSQKEKEEQIGDNCIEDEKDFCQSQSYSQQNPYYLSVKEELQEVFSKFPPENCLKSMFPDSQWARINYAENKYYLVGLIKELNTEKYICYGVPATFSNQPPKELDGYCTFIPLSIYDMQGEGFWMMFQDAITGKCITPTKH